MRILLLAGLVLAGCAHSNQAVPDAAVDPVAYTAYQIQKSKTQKVVVVCVQADEATNERLAAAMAAQLNKDGFQARSLREIVPLQPDYTPLGVLRKLKEAGIKGIIEVDFSGHLTPQGIPESYSLHHRPLKVKKKNVVDRPSRSLTAAFWQLLVSMPLTRL